MRQGLANERIGGWIDSLLVYRWCISDSLTVEGGVEDAVRSHVDAVGFTNARIESWSCPSTGVPSTVTSLGMQIENQYHKEVQKKKLPRRWNIRDNQVTKRRGEVVRQ